MKKSLLSILLFFGFILSYSQKVHSGLEAQKIVQNSELVRTSRFSEAPSFVKLAPGKEVKEELLHVWAKKSLSMTDDDELVLLRSEEDELGFTHKRFQQTRKGVPVEGSAFIFHIKNGKIQTVNGDFFAGITTDCDITLDERSALQKAMDFIGAESYKWEDCNEERFIKWETGDPDASFYPIGKKVIVPINGDPASRNFRVAYKFDIYAQEPMSRDYVFVDAQNGSIIHKINRIHTADTPGSANTAYSGTQSIVADFTGTNYRLRETGRGNGIETYDCNTGTNYGAAVDFTDADNNWNNFNANEDEVATDAHWGSEMTYDYFMTQHSRNSIDNAGFLLRNYIHFDNNYNNAFWDGSRMTYGDGNGVQFTPLTCIDVAGHEVTHGLTTFTAGLVYQNESGALNESFSDIFGTAIENYGRPGNWNWKIGEDITPSGNGIRNMQNPGIFGDPDCYLGTNYYIGTADNGGVHTNSGVQNKWFYILTEGETGTNDLGDGYNVTGQGIVKSGQIAFRNLTVYLTPNSDHSDARFFAIQSAADLFGPCTPEVIATTDAWYAVGVGDPFNFTVTANFGATPLSSCSFPATVEFSNSSENGGTYLWDFGDGFTSTLPNPQHTYNAFGLFTVQLIAYGGACGNDTITKVAYISIDPANSCSVTMIPGIVNDLQTACSGTVYDTGGPLGNYADNQVSSITIAPPGASTVTLNFASFNYEEAYDYLYIYDGPNLSSPLIGSFTGGVLPLGGVVVSTGGSITLREVTDPFVNEGGFDVSWTCALPTGPPVPEFTADFLVTCSGKVQFTDKSTNGPLTWFWEFGDGFTSNAQNPSHSYQASGNYTVKLTTTNAFGSDQENKLTYVQVNKPDGPTTVSASRCGEGSLDLSASGSGNMRWYDASQGGNLLFTGPIYTTPNLTNSVNYYVEDQQVQGIEKVGPVDNLIGSGANYGAAAYQYLEFDVFTPITILSAYVYATITYSRTISVWDNTGGLVMDTIMEIADGEGRYGLNFTLQPGSYRIGGTQMNLFRNNGGVGYPYSIPGKISITGSSAGANFYYFFYDWEVQEETCLSARTPVSATINDMPVAVSSPGGSVNLCAGSSVDLYGSGGATYKWLANGETDDSLNVTVAGDYYVIATSSAGCVDTSDIITVTEVNPVATFTPSGPLEVCDGSGLTLTASSGSNIEWSTGETTPTIEVNSPGTYSVSLTDPNGCDATSSTQGLTVHPAPSTVITSVETHSVCGIDSTLIISTPGLPGDVDTISFQTDCGGLINLTGGAFMTYSWNTGSDSLKAEVSAPGMYFLDIIDANGCIARDSVYVKVEAVLLALPFVSNFYGERDSDIGNNLFWIFDQNTQFQKTYLERTLSLENDDFSVLETFDYSTTGNYSYTDRNLHESETHFYRLNVVMQDGSSHYSNIVELGIFNQKTLTASLFPNPGNGIVQIKTNNIGGSLLLLNSLGQEVKRFDINSPIMDLDISMYSKGIYFFRLSGQNGEAVLKYVKMN